MIKKEKMEKWNVWWFLLSTDTLWWCWLDLIFDAAKEAWFDWIDLAIWKNFDAWNVRYVKKLVAKYNLPVKIIQTSSKLNKKEMDKALDLCEALNIDTICINAPKFFDYRAYNFIKDNIETYKSGNKDIKFSIINPKDANFFAIPLPKYRFSNVVEIIKKYWCNLWLDVSWFDEETFEWDFLRKVDRFVPYMSNLYLCDTTSNWKTHVFPWEWCLKIPELLRKVRAEWYTRYISLKVDMSKVDLADSDKVDLLLKRAVNYYNDYYVNAKID